MSLLTFIRSEAEVACLTQLAPYCRDIDFCMIRRSAVLNLRDAAKSLLARTSFIISRDWHPVMHLKVHEATARNPDLIYVDHMQMFQYVPDPAPCPVILDNHNVEWRIIERFASAGARPAQRLFASVEWRKLRAHELDACRRADLVFTVTAEDRSTLVANGVTWEKVIALPIGVDTEYLRPVGSEASDRTVLTFGTMSWPPNADSVAYFAESIYPHVKREVPRTRFAVIGANPPPAIRALGARDPSIEVAGYVDDLQSAVRGTAAFVVPLRIGSGMRVKILDAMAMALPVVTTSLGCEGICLRPGDHALVADGPEEFAEAVVYLLLNPDTRACLGASGRSFVERHYAWPPIFERLEKAICSVK